MGEPVYISCCSFGKDSIATILLAIEHGEPLDVVVYSEVMFDLANNVSGENPEHVAWIYGTAIPKLEQMGVCVQVLRANRDYKYYFTEAVVKKGPRTGKHPGFALGGMCMVNRDLKLRPMAKFKKTLGDRKIIEYIGIAADEPKRLARLTEGKVSLLAKYGYTEKMAYSKCEENGLLSPIYGSYKRNGCWFCPNARLREYINTRANYPELWGGLRELSHAPNLCTYGFKYGKTLQEIEKQMDEIEAAEKCMLYLF